MPQGSPLNVHESFFWTQIGVAILCSFMIGLERQIRGKPIGIRTSTLICLGTLVFIDLSRGMNSGDPSRVLSQVITGIGFLGAGLIINREGNMFGLTSAAVVWILASIGCAIGFGHFQAAFVITLVALFILVGITQLEIAFLALRKGVHRHHYPDDLSHRDHPKP
ncbi:MAG: MgtC/SapB family protein [Bdellovibrionales bacterium]|nr:MgtC/SapB family protein [Bdellovibrionales bacterium]